MGFLGSLGNLLADAWQLLQLPQTWFVAGVVLVAGIVRGFSGFGGALVFIPLTASIIGPVKAVAVFYLFDLLSATPYGYAYIPKCNKREVAPIVIGAWLMVPFGIWVLARTDPLVLRWVLATIVFLMLGLLVSGWRYRGRPTIPASFGVGAVAGFMGGATGMSGPVVIAYWLSSPSAAAVIRANIMVFYSLVTSVTDVVFFLRGFFTFDVAVYALIAWPLYSGGLAIGARYFKGSGGGHYRLFAYVLIAVSAFLSVPLFDNILR